MLRVRAQTCPRHPEQFMDFNIVWVGGGGGGRERDLEIAILSHIIAIFKVVRLSGKTDLVST